MASQNMSLKYIFLKHFPPALKFTQEKEVALNVKKKPISPQGQLLVRNVEGQRADDLPRLSDDGVVDPAAVAAAFRATLVGVTLGAGIEAAQAVLLQAIAQVSIVADKPAAFVVLLQNSAKEKNDTNRTVQFSLTLRIDSCVAIFLSRLPLL